MSVDTKKKHVEDFLEDKKVANPSISTKTDARKLKRLVRILFQSSLEVMQFPMLISSCFHYLKKTYFHDSESYVEMSPNRLIYLKPSLLN